eukprot:3747133-Rhodomonas_salina.11
MVLLARECYARYSHSVCHCHWHWCAMCGTDIAYAATRCCTYWEVPTPYPPTPLLRDVRYCHRRLQDAIHCPVLTQVDAIGTDIGRRYARFRTDMGFYNAMSGTDSDIRPGGVWAWYWTRPITCTSWCFPRYPSRQNQMKASQRTAQFVPERCLALI